MRNQPHGPIARGTIKTSAVFAVRLLIQAATLLIVARMLGTTHFATFVAAASLALVLGSLSGFGTHILLLAEQSQNARMHSVVLPFAQSVTLISGILLLILYMLMAHLLPKGHSIDLGALGAIGLTELILQPMLRLHSAVSQGRGRIATSQLVMTLPLALRLIAAAALWITIAPHPFRDYAYGYLAASVIAVLIVRFGNRLPRTHAAGIRLPTLSELRNAGGYAVMNLTSTSPAELDKILATQLLPLGVAGVYAAGARIIGAFTLPVIAMMLSAMPRLFREGPRLGSDSSRLLRWIFLSAITYSLVLALLLWEAAPFIEHLFGMHYQDLTTILRWLTLAIPGMGLRIAAGNTLITLGKPWMRSAVEIGGVAILILGSIALTRFLGSIGMTLALSISEWGMAVAAWLIVGLVLRRGR